VDVLGVARRDPCWLPQLAGGSCLGEFSAAAAAAEGTVDGDALGWVNLREGTVDGDELGSG
jgi:hypothetical protein